MEGKHTVYRMSAGTVEEKDDWIACIRYDDLHLRRVTMRFGLTVSFIPLQTKYKPQSFLRHVGRAQEEGPEIWITPSLTAT